MTSPSPETTPPGPYPPPRRTTSRATASATTTPPPRKSPPQTPPTAPTTKAPRDSAVLAEWAYIDCASLPLQLSTRHSVSDQSRLLPLCPVLPKLVRK